MDRIGADFYNVINQIKTRLGGIPIPLQLPIGKEDNFNGIIDLIDMKAIYWNNDDKGINFLTKEIPLDMLNESNKWHTFLIENAIENSEKLTEKYLNNEYISSNELKSVLRKRVLNNEIILITCGSAFKNKGIQTLLDAIIEYLPSPNDIKIKIQNNNKFNIELIKKKKFIALAFKIANDPFVGNLTFFRVYSGKINSGDIILNSIKNEKERLGRIVFMHANKKEEINQVKSGDIAAAIGFKNVTTGDTLCDPNYPIILEKIDFPSPVISIALEPKTKVDQDKMILALNKLAKEDPSFKV